MGEVKTIGIDFSPAVHPRMTGVGRYTALLIDALVRLEAPYRFRLYLPSTAQSGLNPSARLELQPVNFPRYFTTLGLSLKTWRPAPDLYFAPQTTLPLIAPRTSVVTFHDLAWRVVPEDYESTEIAKLEWVARRAVERSSYLITPSESTRRDLIRYLDAPVDRTIAIAYGFSPEPPTITQSPLDRPYLLAIGTHRRKNLKLVVEAFKLLRREALPHQLVIIGEKNPLDRALEASLQTLGPLRSDLIETGYLPRSEVSRYLYHASCLVFPSRYEGFGLPVLEAMAARIPVICSKIPALEEVAGSAALYLTKDTPLELAAILSRVLHSPKLRMQLISKGRARLNRFSWQKCAQATLEVFAAALTESGPVTRR